MYRIRILMGALQSKSMTGSFFNKVDIYTNKLIELFIIRVIFIVGLSRVSGQLIEIKNIKNTQQSGYFLKMILLGNIGVRNCVLSILQADSRSRFQN